MTKQTIATKKLQSIRSVVPPATPRGLNQEIGSVNLVQEEGISARTAFVGPFQEDLHGGQEAQGEDGSIPPLRGGPRLPTRLVRQGAVTLVCRTTPRHCKNAMHDAVFTPSPLCASFRSLLCRNSSIDFLHQQQQQSKIH